MDIMWRFSGVILVSIYSLLMLLFGKLPMEFDYFFSITLLCLLGVSHGAGDHLIAQKLSTILGYTFHLKLFIMYYVGIMILYLIGWLVFPYLCFLIFIGISIFHFGELEHHSPSANQTDSLPKILEFLRTISLGTGILLWILMSHQDEISSILVEMKIPLDRIHFIHPAWSLIFLALGFSKTHIQSYLNTCITLFIGTYIPLIPAFICYFSGCHAIYSLRSMSKFLELPILLLLKKLIPFSLTALLLGAVFVFFFMKQVLFGPIFIFLSVLTLPHFILMHMLVKAPNA
ncbi:beta-carotene 15,15'-dioxygenase, Brp/Blh family [Aquirufa sp. Wall-65K1]